MYAYVYIHIYMRNENTPIHISASFRQFADYPPRYQIEKHVGISLTVGYLAIKSNRKQTYATTWKL